MGQALTTPFDRHSPALKAYRRAARMLLVQPGMRILDAGCGLGAGSWLLAMLGAHVTGVDRSAEAVAWATATYGSQPLRKGGRVQYAVADLSTWQPPARFDAVVVADVLEHFPAAAGPALLQRLLAGLDISDAQPAQGWHDGLFLHLPLTANAMDWLLLIKNRLLGQRLRGRVLDHHGDPTHRARYGLRDLLPLAQAAGSRVERIELRVYRPRLRLLERQVCAGRLTPLARGGGSLLTDCDAILLPELVAVLRHAALDPALGVQSV